MFRKYGGRLLIVAAGGGCLALVFFVFEPTLFAPAPPMPQDEIVAEGLGADERQDEIVAGTLGTNERQDDVWKVGERRESQGVMPVYSPLVGVRNDGGEVAVVFPAAEPGAGTSRAASAEIAEEESGLPQILSAADVAEARAALEGQEPEPVVVVEPDAAAAIEDEADTAELPHEAAAGVVPPVAETPGAVEAEHARRDTPGESEDEASLSALPARQAEAVETESGDGATAQAMPVERVSAGGDGRPGNVKRLADRRGEFDMPVWSDSRTPLEVSHPSGGVPDDGAAGVARAGGQQSGPAPREVKGGVVVPGTLRGVMGYRLPLISRQEVPGQIVSGVLIPAHTTFVILKEGSWELVDVTPEELERFRKAAALWQAPAPEVEPVRRHWSPLRIFRKREAPAAQHQDAVRKER